MTPPSMIAGAGGRPSPAPRRAGPVAAVLLPAVLLAAALLNSRVVAWEILALACVFVPLERVLTLRAQRTFRLGWAGDLVHSVVNNGISTAGIGAAVVVTGVLLRHGAPAVIRSEVALQPGWAQLAGAVVVGELGGYWGHRAAHRVPLLWRFHRVHHSIEEMDWLAAGRIHPVDQVFTRSCALVPVFVVGFSHASLGGYLALTTLQSVFDHANVRTTFGPLRWVVSTPQFHHWHHAEEVDARDCNFAGVFPVLDVVFGSAHLPGRHPERYGLGERAPQGYLSQLVWPLALRGRSLVGAGEAPAR